MVRLVGVLTDPHHQRRGADRLIVCRVDDLHVGIAVGNAGPLEPAGEKELHRSACNRQGQLEIVPRGVRNGGVEGDLPALGGALILQSDGYWTGGSGWVGEPGLCRRRRPADIAGGGSPVAAKGDLRSHNPSASRWSKDQPCPTILDRALWRCNGRADA